MRIGTFNQTRTLEEMKASREEILKDVNDPQAIEALKIFNQLADEKRLFCERSPDREVLFQPDIVVRTDGNPDTDEAIREWGMDINDAILDAAVSLKTHIENGREVLCNYSSHTPTKKGDSVLAPLMALNLH